MENETHKFLMDRKAKLLKELSMIEAGLGSTNHHQIKRHGKPDKKMTVPEMLLAVLEENKDGLKTEEAAEAFAQRYSREMSKINCSSYLSTLKKKGKTDLNREGKWIKK